MAYLDEQHLTCPDCGATGQITWVVGIGPHTRPGAGPAYKTLHDAGPWRVETHRARPFFEGHLDCPDCGAQVLNRPATDAGKTNRPQPATEIETKDKG